MKGKTIYIDVARRAPDLLSVSLRYKDGEHYTRLQRLCQNFTDIKEYASVTILKLGETYELGHILVGCEISSYDAHKIETLQKVVNQAAEKANSKRTKK